MFRPMAITVCSALLGSLILALTAVPALSTYFLRTRAVAPAKKLSEKWYAQLRRMRDWYARSLDFALNHRTILVALALVLVVVRAGFAALHRDRIHAQAG